MFFNRTISLSLRLTKFNDLASKRNILFLTATIAIIIVVVSIYGGSDQIDYNIQVKPLLNKHCISCHGGVKVSGAFSLMTRELALRETESGNHGIEPGDSDASEMIKRIRMTDPDDRMPKNAQALSNEEINILTKWVEQGAKWGLHWAYEPLDNKVQEKGIAQLSGIGQSDEKENTLSQRIDERIQSKLSATGLSLNAKASKSELLRRVSLDIIGMPPSSTIRKAFLRQENAISYTELVEQLLASPSFGEKWTSMWLDVARYADSRGFESDRSRSIWAYRDYVIKSLNEAKPFDTFIIEQMAGDLIHSPSDEQLIATGFHRNTPTNDEGGTDNEEYRIRAVMDRVSTTWGGLMGTTMACVQCHGHPYDPFPHENFYQTFAFLNNTRDADTGKDYPRLKLLDSLEETKLEELTTWVSSVASEEESHSISRFLKTGQPAIYSSETDELVNANIYGANLGIRKNGTARIPNVHMTGVHRILMPLNSFENGGILTFHLDDPTGPEIKRINLTKKSSDFLDLDIRPYEGLHDIYLKYRNPSMASTEKRGVQFDWFYFASTFPGENDQSQNKYKKLFHELVTSQSPHTLIMSPNPEERQRKTHLFDRGNWASPTEEVHPDIPEIFTDFQDENQPDRLAFAEWIVNDNNPLTARTITNRVWEQLWGNGIVVTTEDLGSQGSKPSHPEVLNDIAYTWMHDYNWNIKDLIKAIVTTEAYQQSAKLDAQKVEKDPYNELLSRGPRVRLTAEQIRDQALNISGLLSSKMYGPPVMPIQPSGIWETPYNNEAWQESSGEDRYRRALYTFIKRSALYPSLMQFDMSTRSVCESRRIQTNTPLQALVTLNDPAFIECASALANRMDKEGGDSLAQKINYAYYLGLNKNISVEKSEILE
ncbi:MAG: hypothetical protein ACI9FN_001130, partial [Saprospiraceae bacterium]